MNEKTIKNWLSLAKYDIDTAQAMLKSGRYLYVAYMCQQTIEKVLKAIYVKEKQLTPPYTHNLRRLSKEISIDQQIDDSKLHFIDILNSYYLESRYSEDIENLSKTINKIIATDMFNKTNDLYEWLITKTI